ncbi:unnamed protein product [Adineta ricciae]|uniref:Uncharacterized protein n=1 Tax=Adineta ricciae TaxID=249248 RepID=A0A815S4Q2_ADIRI|nr:unnamed protein product [Adineta ricciae]CAF1484263.1 unnamed protein product [Adineta ricciae]
MIYKLVWFYVALLLSPTLIHAYEKQTELASKGSMLRMPAAIALAPYAGMALAPPVYLALAAAFGVGVLVSYGISMLNENNEEPCSSNGRLPLGRKSTGRSTPRDLNEQIALRSAITASDYGKFISPIGDSAWPEPGWYKMSFNYPLSNGRSIELHYNRNKFTCDVDDFKFKN